MDRLGRPVPCQGAGVNWPTEVLLPCAASLAQGALLPVLASPTLPPLPTESHLPLGAVKCLWGRKVPLTLSSEICQTRWAWVSSCLVSGVGGPRARSPGGQGVWPRLSTFRPMLGCGSPAAQSFGVGAVSAPNHLTWQQPLAALTGTGTRASESKSAWKLSWSAPLLFMPASHPGANPTPLHRTGSWELGCKS